MAAPEHPTLVVAALAAGAAGAMYLHLGRALLRRPVLDAQARLALRMFGVWWLTTGVNILLGSLFIAAAAFDATSLSLQTSYTILQRLLLAASLVGLMHYLLVLVRGRPRMVLLGVLYGLYAMVQVASIYAGRPEGVYVGQWRTDLLYADEGAFPTWLTALLGAFLILPPVVLSLVAVALARRLGDGQGAQRNRITVVGLALAIWWVVAVLAGQREAFDQEFLQLFNRLLGLTMALAIFLAYEPPAWLARLLPLGRSEAAPRP